MTLPGGLAVSLGNRPFICDQTDAFRYWITSLARASTYGIDTAKDDGLSIGAGR
jgi:hypothetical protein